LRCINMNMIRQKNADEVENDKIVIEAAYCQRKIQEFKSI